MKRIVTVIVVMMTLIPALVIGCAVNYYIQNTIRHDALSALGDIAQMMEEHLNKSYDRLVSDIQAKAKNDVLQRVLNDAEHSSKTGVIDYSGAVEVLLESKAFPVAGGAIINTDGKVVLSSQPDEEGLMLNRTELYQDIIFGKSTYAGLVMKEEIADTVEIAVPIRDDQNKMIGILKQNIDVTLLSDYLGSIQFGNSCEAFLIRENGFMIFDKDPESTPLFYYEYQDKHSLEQLVMDYKQGRFVEEQGSIEFDSKGIEYVGAYKKVDAIGSIAVISIRKDEIYGSLLEMEGFLVFISLIVMAIIAAGGYIIIYFHITPIKKMNDTLKKIASGDMTARCGTKKNNEFGELGKNINYLADSYQKNERELRMSSRIDNLTHLPNQNAIYELLDTLLYKHRNQAMMLLDLDGFKDVNDNLGYDVGDKILMEIGDILRELPQHVCYSSRLAGAEFLVFITNWTSPKYPEKLAENIIKKIEEIRFIDEVRVDISSNIGIVYMESGKADRKKLIKHSNIALHKAKSIGRNVYFVHYPNMVKD